MSSFVLKRKEFDLDGHHIVQVYEAEKFCAPRWYTYIDGQEWNYQWPWFKGHDTRPSKSKIRKQIEMYF